MILSDKNKPISELSLKDLVIKIANARGYLFSRWKTILVFALIGLAMGLISSLVKRTVYTADLTFVLEDGGDSGGRLGQYAGLASMAGIDIGSGGGIFQGDNIMELYKSRKMIEQTLLSKSSIGGKKVLLIERYIKAYKLREKWDEKSYLKNIDFSDSTRFDIRQDSIIGNIVTEINKKCLLVSKPDKKLTIIKVEVKSIDELFAKAFTESLVGNVNNFYVKTKTKKSLENIAILQHQTDSVRSVMNGSINTSASVIDATPNLNPTRQVLRASVQRSQFSAETNKAILSELVKNLELSKISLRKETPLIQVIDEPVLPLDKDKPSKAIYMVLGSLVFSIFSVVYLLLKRSLAN